MIVLLIPARSDFIPAEADTHSRITRSIEINIPLVSAPMDTVTESALAIALAQEGRDRRDSQEHFGRESGA